MGLSRLSNFLNSPRGTIFYVDVNALDATDSIENRGTSQTRPFRSLQRALAETARYSYQRGFNNDRFGKSTIMVNPGTYFIDNRPGAIVKNNGTLSLRNGASTTINEWDLISNFDLFFDGNDLYKLNSVYGGVIVPRGCSIVCLDIRKTKFIPLYVPDPENDNIERSAIFRLTGSCFLYGFSAFDSDPNGNCYKDYTSNLFVPNFSHHKLALFEYADGVNDVSIDDEFQTVSTTRTDLEMYYDKIARVYGNSSGRPIADDVYPGTSIIDIQPVVDEYRIVGSRGKEVGITSIRAGNGSNAPTTTITATLSEPVDGLSIDSPIQISGVGAAGYDGQYVIYNVLSSNEVQYRVQNIPTNPLPGVTGATLNLAVDTVTSASPYIFNVSLRSVYGMCGLHADGSKADGFRSVVIAQFTGISNQKDDNAFVIYDPNTGSYRDSTVVTNLHTNSKARFKPKYENYHIKASNNSFLQLVSVFGIGYSNQFVAESGGDFSITNSNSNFGANSLIASGYRSESFVKDDVGYITHIIPPQELESDDISVEFYSIDVGLTTSRSSGAGTTTKLYLYNETNFDQPPLNIFDGYRIGAKNNETLRVQIFENGTTSTYETQVVIPDTTISFEKSFNVAKTGNNDNSIVNSTINLTSNHTFAQGESVRITSDNGHLPDGLKPNQIYYSIVDGLNPNQVKLAQTLNGSLLGESIDFNSKGGNLKITSRVSDKNTGDIGHPIQWDTYGNWYISVSSTNNEIYDKILQLGVSGLGKATSRTFIKRKPDTRSLIDTLYRFRYVIPKDSSVSARPPLDGYIIQESSTSNAITSTDITSYFSDSPVTLTNSDELRNIRFISNITWSGGYVTVTTELDHKLRVNSSVEIYNVLPLGYNGNYTVTEIINSRQFKFKLDTNPGVFSSDTSTRNKNLPVVKKKNFTETYQIYRTQEVQPYIQNEQDGVYHLIVTNCSNSPVVEPFRGKKFNQPIQNLYPQINRDNPNSDPDATKSFAVSDPIGQVVIDNVENSITKETLQETLKDFSVGFGITSIVSNSTGTAHTIHTSIDHSLAGITSVKIISGGSNYLSGTYYGVNLVGFAGSTTGGNASVKILVNDNGGGIGTITSVSIMHPGSAYGIGNTLNIVPNSGIGTTTGFVPAVVEVVSTLDPINDTISITGIGGSHSTYNSIYRITNVENEKKIQVSSASTISNFSTVSLGSTVVSDSYVIKTGKAISISSFDYSSSSGIATVGFTTSHGLLVNNKIRLSGFDHDYFNKNVIVKRQNSLTSVVVSVGKDGSGLPTTGTNRYALLNGYSSNAGSVTNINENIGGRLVYEYGGVTSYLLTSLETTSISNILEIQNALELGLKLGDYLQVNNEIFRIKSTVTSNSVSVFRSILGSKRETHTIGAVVRKIKVTPVEFRRNSIIRASGHTFEYVGFGPGNYSTSLPERQDRILSPQEELIAQFTKENGGIVNFTAMNGDGDFYTGNKKINSATGQEEIFDSPVPTVTGEELSSGTLSSGFDILSPLEATITRSLRVEGGPNSNLISEFDGPVIFNNKITSYSNKGIEAYSLYLQGTEEISRRLSINFEKPSFAGNYGDIEFNSKPEKYGFAGWIYTTNNEWENWGFIGGPGVGISSDGAYVGFSTLINLKTSGINLTTQYTSSSGITTVILDANPRVAISTGTLNTTVGIVTQINFIGAGVSVNGSTTSGIATVSITTPNVSGIGVPGAPFNSIQWNNGGVFGGIPISTYDNINNRVVFGDVSLYNSGNISNSVIFDLNGYVGFSSASPTSKIEIVADNERAIYIKSTQGTEIIRIENTTNDTTPFIIDQNGRVGINTVSTISDLDVIGNASVTGQLRIYRENNRNNYVGFSVTNLTSNYVYILPNSYGINGQVLTSNGSGGLTWQTFTGGNIVNSGVGITITYNGQTATIANTGVRRIIAGAGVSITPANGTGDVTVSATTSSSNGAPYPFTTRGFSIPL